MVTTLAVLGLLACGFGLGLIVSFLTVVRPLLTDLRRMQYDGFRAVHPLPPRPKTVPPTPYVRED